jgi:hypothetical protein
MDDVPAEPRVVGEAIIPVPVNGEAGKFGKLDEI